MNTQNAYKGKIIYIVTGKHCKILEVFYYYDDAINYIDNLEDENKYCTSLIEKEIK